MLVWRSSVGVVEVSAYMGGTRGLGVLSSACDVLEMSVVRGVGGVCDMCMCLARGVVGGEWVTGLGLGFTNSGGRGPTEGACSMVVPAMSTSARRMPYTHPAIRNANHW